MGYNHPVPLYAQHIQRRLLILAGSFLFFYSLALSLSPAARARSWDVDYRWAHWLGFAVWVLGVAFAVREAQRRLPHYDPYLVSISALLSGWGLLTIWRLFPAFGLRQTIWLALGLAIFTLGLRLPQDLGFLRRFKYLWLTGGLFLTGATLIFGVNPANTGPEQWLGCCGVYFQPSEPLKLLLLGYLAAYLADRGELTASIRQANSRGRQLLLALLAPTLVMTGLALLILIVQRDLGTASILLFIYASLIFLGANQRGIVLGSLAGAAVMSVVGYALFDVVRLRVDSWLNPWADPAGRSYQIVQSLIAVASGEIFGRGPGLGNPSLVPLSHSDFIFTSLVEEGGLFGVVAFIGLLALFLNRGMRVALRTGDPYRRYLAAGISAYLAAQSLLIIGGNLRLLPLTGVTLPFVSYGGSSLVTSFLCLLLLTLMSGAPNPASLAEAKPLPAHASSVAVLGISNVLLAGLGLAAVYASWWVIVRGPDLTARTDNPRQAIADRFVYRGYFLDQRGRRLTANEGQPGQITRVYLEPTLAPVLGYSHPIFGQAGLEASLDRILRGLEGQSWVRIWWHQFLFGQHPPGLDVRLSIDLDLQRLTSAQLDERAGAIVLLNAQSGEILAMASSPTYDPNLLDSAWVELVNDPRAPLLNRAVQGAYPPGAGLGPMLYAAASVRRELTLPGNSNAFQVGDYQLTCAFELIENTWERAIQAGCPTPAAILGGILGDEGMLNLFTNLGLFTPPAVQLPAHSSLQPSSLENSSLAALGTDLAISPLQMALAAATLSNDGQRPSPRLALAYLSPESGWQLLPPLSGGPEQVFTPQAARAIAIALAVPGHDHWESVAKIAPASEGVGGFTWYLGGTLPSWTGVPVVVTVILEEVNVDAAVGAGRAVLNAILSGR